MTATNITSSVKAQFVMVGETVAVLGAGRFTVTGTERIVVDGVENVTLYGTNYAGQSVCPVVPADQWVQICGSAR